jgi:phosphate uptake regulator
MELTEVRKLEPMGKFSVGVTLPKWWIRGHKLKVGSTVRLVVTPDQIVFRLETEVEQ